MAIDVRHITVDTGPDMTDEASPGLCAGTEEIAMNVESGRPMGLFAVKAAHTLIFFSLSWAVLYILYSGLTNRVSRKTAVALAAALGEAIVFLANGRRCPLTKLAEGLGAVNGTVGDIFLPQWFARRIPQISSTLIAVGLLAMLRHRLHARLANGA